MRIDREVLSSFDLIITTRMIVQRETHTAYCKRQHSVRDFADLSMVSNNVEEPKEVVPVPSH